MKPLSYISFYISASNAHGIHSPFVYDFITKGLYVKRRSKHSKTTNLLFKVLDYFKPNTITEYGATDNLKKTVLAAYKKLEFKENSHFTYFNLSSKEARKRFQWSLNNMEGNILYIDELRKDKSTYKLWLETLNSQRHFISVDLYYSGIIFFRPKQAKQHFRIRI